MKRSLGEIKPTEPFADAELELLTKEITNRLGNTDGWMTIAKNVEELKSLLRS